MATTIRLVRPAPAYLPAYRAALERGWSPDNIQPEATARAHLDAIAADSAAFLGSLDDPEGKGPPVRLPDGSLVPRIPGFKRWIWDGDFCGSVGLRWQEGRSALPSHVLGHIGFAIVPWKRRRGYATLALGAMLELARAQGLDHVELTTDPENLASQGVIVKCGGVLVERFRKSAAYGGVEALRFRIAL